MISTTRADRIWRSTKRSFYVVLIGWALVVGINFWDAHKAGQSLPWSQILTMFLMLVWGFIVLGACWLVYKFIRRNAEFYERNK
jgi:hypothetical protein